MEKSPQNVLHKYQQRHTKKNNNKKTYIQLRSQAAYISHDIFCCGINETSIRENL